LFRSFYIITGAAWEALVARIAARELDPYTAATELLESEASKQ
jgi:hypothetical protein